MNIIVRANPFIHSIYHVPQELYTIEHDLNFRGIPSIHEHIILNQRCATITFVFKDDVFITDSNVICGKFTHAPKITVNFRSTCKRLTVIRLNALGMFKLTDIPLSTMVDQITQASKISLDLSEDLEADHCLAWIEAKMTHSDETLPYRIVREIITYIDANFTYLPANISYVISKEFALSESTIHRYFKKYIGVNLSTYMVTLRRKKMIRSLYHGKYDALSVKENGYYDQSHFINDFKRLFGITIRQYQDELHFMKRHSPEFVHFLYDHNA